jgi:hypothetical protein
MSLTLINFNNTTPAPPDGFANVTWQKDENGNLSAYTGSGASLDVVLSDPQAGDILVYTGPSINTWINEFPLLANDADVAISDPENGQTLLYNASLDLWVNGTAPGASTFEASSTPLISSGVVNFEGDGTYISVSNPSAGNVTTALNYSTLVTALASSLASTFLPLAGGTLTGALALAASDLKDSMDAAGSSGQVLTISSSTGFPVWQNSSSGFANPMTTAGDLIYEDSTPAPNRLGIGTDGQVLTVVDGLPAWAAGGGGSGFPTGANIALMPPFTNNVFNHLQQGVTTIYVIPAGMVRAFTDNFQVVLNVLSPTVAINNAVLRRTTPGSMTWTDTTQITWGASATPTFSSAGSQTSDSIALTMDADHDLYFLIYWVSDTGTVVTNDNFTYGEYPWICGYISGDNTSTSDATAFGAANAPGSALNGFWFGVQQLLTA